MDISTSGYSNGLISTSIGDFQSHLHFDLPRFACFALQAQDYSFFEMVSLQVDRGGSDGGEYILPGAYGRRCGSIRTIIQPSFCQIVCSVLTVFEESGLPSESRLWSIFEESFIVSCVFVFTLGLVFAKPGNRFKRLKWWGNFNIPRNWFEGKSAGNLDIWW